MSHNPRSDDLENLQVGPFSGWDARAFWAKVQKTDGCWWWTGSVTGSLGYGQCSTARPVFGTAYAHRVAWMLAHDQPVPDGLEVRHACDQPSCVNPAHLSVGTHAENVRDAQRRQRLRVPHPRAQKVPDALLPRLWQMRAAGSTLRAIAGAFGLSVPAVSLILRGQRRQHGLAVAAARKAS